MPWLATLLIFLKETHITLWLKGPDHCGLWTFNDGANTMASPVPLTVAKTLASQRDFLALFCPDTMASEDYTKEQMPLHSLAS